MFWECIAIDVHYVTNWDVWPSLRKDQYHGRLGMISYKSFHVSHTSFLLNWLFLFRCSYAELLMWRCASTLKGVTAFLANSFHSMADCCHGPPPLKKYVCSKGRNLLWLFWARATIMHTWRANENLNCSIVTVHKLVYVRWCALPLTWLFFVLKIVMFHAWIDSWSE